MQNDEALLPDMDDLVHAYYPAVVRLAISILDDGSSVDVLDEAEDAAQETFISAAKAMSAYRGSASLKTWLFAIAINACRSRLRRRKARRAMAKTLGALQRALGSQDAPEGAAVRSERDRQLWQAVDRLDEKHRLVVLLRYVQELPAAEIAQVLEITEGTVHSRLHYARRQLAIWLRRDAMFEEAETA